MIGANKKNREPTRKLSYYDVLCVFGNATTEDIKAAYKILSLIYHPDKQGPDSAISIIKELSQQVNKAYQILSDNEIKKLYDAALSERKEEFYADDLDHKVLVDEVQSTAEEVAEIISRLQNQINTLIKKNNSNDVALRTLLVELCKIQRKIDPGIDLNTVLNHYQLTEDEKEKIKTLVKQTRLGRPIIGGDSSYNKGRSIPRSRSFTTQRPQDRGQTSSPEHPQNLTLYQKIIDQLQQLAELPQKEKFKGVSDALKTFFTTNACSMSSFDNIQDFIKCPEFTKLLDKTATNREALSILLHSAVKKKFVEIIELCLALGVDPNHNLNASATLPNSAMRHSLVSFDQTIVNTLIEHGGEIDQIFLHSAADSLLGSLISQSVVSGLLEKDGSYKPSLEALQVIYKKALAMKQHPLADQCKELINAYPKQKTEDIKVDLDERSEARSGSSMHSSPEQAKSAANNEELKQANGLKVGSFGYEISKLLKQKLSPLNLDKMTINQGGALFHIKKESVEGLLQSLPLQSSHGVIDNRNNDANELCEHVPDAQPGVFQHQTSVQRSKPSSHDIAKVLTPDLSHGLQFHLPINLAPYAERILPAEKLGGFCANLLPWPNNGMKLLGWFFTVTIAPNGVDFSAVLMTFKNNGLHITVENQQKMWQLSFTLEATQQLLSGVLKSASNGGNYLPDGIVKVPNNWQTNDIFKIIMQYVVGNTKGKSLADGVNIYNDTAMSATEWYTLDVSVPVLSALVIKRVANNKLAELKLKISLKLKTILEHYPLPRFLGTLLIWVPNLVPKSPRTFQHQSSSNDIEGSNNGTSSVWPSISSQSSLTVTSTEPIPALSVQSSILTSNIAKTSDKRDNLKKAIIMSVGILSLALSAAFFCGMMYCNNDIGRKSSLGLGVLLAAVGMSVMIYEIYQYCKTQKDIMLENNEDNPARPSSELSGLQVDALNSKQKE